MVARLLWPCLTALGLLAADGPFWVQGPQGRLRAEAAGPAAGLTLLLIHGNGGSRRQWAGQLAHFSKTRRVVAFDLRGEGDSDPPKDGDYSVAAMVTDALAVADAAHLDRFVVVGHSYGGAVAGALAGAQPQRVAALLLDDVAGDMRATPVQEAEAMRRALQPERFQDTTRAWFEQILAKAAPATRERVLEDLARTPREAFVGAYSGLLRYDPAAALARHPGPKLHLYTDVLAGSPLAVHAGLAGLQAIHLAGTSHWPQLDRPDAFNAVLEDFLLRAAAFPDRAGQLGFWPGDWEIRSPRGELLGEERVRAEQEGRVLVGRFRSAQGREVSSFTAWDGTAGLWHQTRVEADGPVLQLSGGVQEGRLLLVGSRGGAGQDRDRLAWELRPDGTLRHTREASRDGGTTWLLAFEGICRRMPAPH